MGTQGRDVSAASRGGNPYCRWRGRFGLPTMSIRAGLALVEKASEICVPFESRLNLDRNRMEDSMLELLRRLNLRSKSVARLFEASTLWVCPSPALQRWLL